MENLHLRRLLLLVPGLLLAASAAFAEAPATKPAPAKAVIGNDDCAKCHTVQPADIAAAGGKHKSEIGCIDCHTGHRPSSAKNIPECSNCHSGKPHYQTTGCLNCHKNPHTPLTITFAGNLTDQCLACHTPQITQLRDNKSKHTLLACTTCHRVHRQVPQCVQCHKPHSVEMTATDCKQCHKAHMPKAVTYAATIPNKSCASCHQKAFSLLAASKAKHAKLACAFCHKDKHKAVPKCQDCHGTPHPAGMMAKFGKCGDCHGIAHDVNNFSDMEKKGAQKADAPAKDAPKKDAPKKSKKH
jgi:hypothetical protein